MPKDPKIQSAEIALWKVRLLRSISDGEKISHSVRGERRLHQRILEIALEDYCRHKEKDLNKVASEVRSQFYSARNWIFGGREPETYIEKVMDFKNVCLILDVPPAGIRKLAKELTLREMKHWIRHRR